MVRVHVGEQDGVDRVGRDADGGEPARQLPQRRPHAVARPGVDQRQPAGRFNEERVDGDARRHPAALAPDQIFRVGRQVAHDR
jgi:hypothetical protein